MLTQRFYLSVALATSCVVGLIYTANNILRVDEGYHLSIFIRDFSWGALFTLLIWCFNIYWFNWFVLRFLSRVDSRAVAFLRLLLSLLFGELLVHLNESFNIIPVELPGYWSHELANEVRGGITTAVILLLFYILRLMSGMHLAILENERLIRENTTAQFESLKQQIHPHFLFNSLNILKTMVRASDPKSEEYVLRLSEFYRNLLVNRDREVTTLGEELATLEHYIFMLKTRFGNKLRFDIRIPEALKSTLLPPLTLQLLIENCIKHNVVSDDRPLLIDIFGQDSWLVVSNNIQAKRTVEKSTHIGLANINKRYELISQRSIHIENDGQRFSVKLPLFRS